MRRGRILHGVRCGGRLVALRQFRAPAAAAQDEEGSVGSGDDQGRADLEQGRLEAQHRSGEPVRAARELVFVTAVRLCEYLPRQQAVGGGSVAQACAGGRSGRRSVGVALAGRPMSATGQRPAAIDGSLSGSLDPVPADLLTAVRTLRHCSSCLRTRAHRRSSGR